MDYNTVKRYEEMVSMPQSSTGEYVLHEDYQTLLTELERLHMLAGPSGKNLYQLEQLNDELCEENDKLEAQLDSLLRGMVYGEHSDT